MRIFAAVLALGLAASGATTPRFTATDRRARLMAALPEVEAAFQRYQQRMQIPGMVYGVVIDGETVFTKGLGVRDRASNDPVTAKTLFRIASMTKSFTALAILTLRDEGKLSLEDPVSKWIPEFARMQYPTSDTAPIRVRHLLSHSAGFPEDNPWGDRQLGVSDPTMTQWLEQGLPFSTPPATAYEYSNYGFALLGRIVTAASHTPYREYVEKQIIAPLGMRATTLETSAAPAELRATGYRRIGSDYSIETPLPHGAFGAMGGLWTSAEDLGRYVAFHLSAYPPRDGDETGPVRRSSVREQETLARPAILRVDRSGPDGTLKASAGGYGFGVSVMRDCRFNHIVAHGGGLPGFGSYMLWLPDYGVGLFAMANLTYAGPAAPIDEALDILRKTGALEPRELPVSPALESARDSIMKLWTHWNDREAEAVVADNFFLDKAATARRAEIEKIQADVGQCRPSGPIHPENLLRGTFRMACDRGSVDVTFTLAPTMPPRIQMLAFTPAQPLSGPLKAAAQSLAAEFSAHSEDGLRAIAAPALDMRALRRDFELLGPAYGSCRVGETRASDGTTFARIRLNCDRASLDLSVRADAQGKITAASFSRPPETACIP